MNYYEFLKQKQITTPVCGFSVDKNSLNEKAFDWQKDIVAWALKNGRRAVGVELKPTWYQQAVRNCKGVTEAEQTSLW